MRHIADEKPYHVPSTIEDLTVLEEIGEVCVHQAFKQI
jgi:hypothetical protein